jgi:CheY-like chemotaxis protein
VVLLDIGMPGLNGYDTARLLRREPWGGRAMLIAVTGWGQPDDRRRAEQAGFDRHLVKPVDVASLSEMLRTSRPPAAVIPFPEH